MASAYAIKNRDEFAARVREASEIRQSEAAKDLKRRINRIKKRCSVLTTPMIYEFIDRIVVHAPTREYGDREQTVDIYLKFIGKFDVPMPEPTAEELAEQDEQRRRRAYYRERSKRERERKKAKREETLSAELLAKGAS